MHCVRSALPYSSPDRGLSAQFVIGYGVGGEYPMAAGSAAERAEAGGRRAATKRGREASPCTSLSPKV